MEQPKAEFYDSPITETLLLSCRFLVYYNERTKEAICNRAHIEHHPRAYWDSTDVYSLSIHCRANAHGDYYLHLSRHGNDGLWHCFLINGKWSETFIHLRQLATFGELHEVIWAITRCNLFLTEHAMKEYCKQVFDYKEA